MFSPEFTSYQKALRHPPKHPNRIGYHPDSHGEKEAGGDGPRKEKERGGAYHGYENKATEGGEVGPRD